ncbi:ABC transporter ATP-binding protein [Acetanaerobacterium elongatum]|nr:ABC transporter ATP-binding protein [Acetanaerobacterium elongatum]
MSTALVVQNLTKSYGPVKAVDGLSFKVEKGEIFGLLGHNGAGKSTSIECILGVKRYDAGSVTVLGLSPAENRRQLFEKVGVQFQHNNYPEKITVSELCEVTGSLYRQPADWKELLKRFGLLGMHKRMVTELSGGERQRLSVILALIPNPELVFLDELTTGLDSKARRDVWKYLESLKGNGLTILLTSHYMDEVQTLCDRICILRKGQVVFMGTLTEAIQNSPCSNLEEAYLWYSGEEETTDEVL